MGFLKRAAHDHEETRKALQKATADNERLLSLLRTATLERDAFLGKNYALKHLTKCQECGSYYDHNALMESST